MSEYNNTIQAVVIVMILSAITIDSLSLSQLVIVRSRVTGWMWIADY